MAKGHFRAALCFLADTGKWRTTAGKIVGGGGGCVVGVLVGLIGSLAGLFIGGAVFKTVAAAIGLALLGGLAGFGISVALGGVAGGKIGAGMGDVEKEREGVLSNVFPDIHAHVESTRSARVNEFDKAKEAALLTLDEAVKAHTLAYSGAVSQMIEEHQRKLSRLAEEGRQADIDSAELRTRTKRLQEKRQQLRSANF